MSNGSDLEITVQQTGVKDIRRALAGVETLLLRQVLDETQQAVKDATQQAVSTIRETVDTSGAGMPYKHDLSTDARVHTGAMRESVGSRWERDDDKGMSVFVGFVSTPEYTVFQEEGTRKLRAMGALAKARAQAEDVLDSVTLSRGSLGGLL